MTKRQEFIKCVKTFGAPFSTYHLFNRLKNEMEQYEVNRYLYRFKQMGFVTSKKIVILGVNRNRPINIWKVIDKNFTTKGKTVGLVAATRRAVAAANNEFYLRRLKGTLNRFTREDLSDVLTRLRKKHKLIAKKELVRSINLYFKS